MYLSYIIAAILASTHIVQSFNELLGCFSTSVLMNIFENRKKNTRGPNEVQI